MINFRIIPQLEKYPAIVAFVQTWPGKLLTILVTTYLLSRMEHRYWPEVGITALLTALFKIQDRRKALLGLALYIVLLRPLAYVVILPKVKYLLLHLSYMENWIFLKEFSNAHNSNFGQIYSTLISLTVILFSMGLTHYIMTSRFELIRKWPVGSLVIANLLLIFIGKSIPQSTSFTYMYWVALVLFNTIFISNFCYTLLHQKKLQHESPIYWLGPGVLFCFPFGKSNAYLTQVAAKNDTELAVTQIKALKLLIWMLFLRYILIYIGPLIGIPGYTTPLTQNIHLGNISDHYTNFFNNTPSPTGIIWLSLFVTYIYDLLIWALKFNVPVIVLRMFGFYVPRGMYKPLYSKSIPEYFGRRYYYYKEFIFDIFVLPLILRFRSIQNRRVRNFLAIFLGVAFGSILTHTTGSIAELYTIDILHYLERSAPFYFRCIAFGLLIGVFQFGNPLPVTGMKYERFRHVLNVLIIILLFSLAKVFTPMMRSDNPLETFRFFESLFKF